MLSGRASVRTSVVMSKRVRISRIDQVDVADYNVQVVDTEDDVHDAVYKQKKKKKKRGFTEILTQSAFYVNLYRAVIGPSG